MNTLHLTLSSNAPLWLQSAVDFALSGWMPDKAKAIGLMYRFDPPTQAAAQETMAALLAGEEDPARTLIRNWWGSLPSMERRHIRSIAVSRAWGLLEDLNEADWMGTFGYICTQREFLESTRACLAAAGVSDDLDVVLSAVDNTAKRVTDKLLSAPKFEAPLLAAINRELLLPVWWTRWAVHSLAE